MVDQAARRSREFWGQGYYCAESVLLAIAESRGVQSELIPRIAIMGLSLADGRGMPPQSAEPSHALVGKSVWAFEECYGSTNCFELTGCDPGTEKGKEAFRANRVGERGAGPPGASS